MRTLLTLLFTPFLICTSLQAQELPEQGAAPAQFPDYTTWQNLIIGPCADGRITLKLYATMPEGGIIEYWHNDTRVLILDSRGTEQVLVQFDVFGETVPRFLPMTPGTDRTRADNLMLTAFQQSLGIDEDLADRSSADCAQKGAAITEAMALIFADDVLRDLLTGPIFPADESL